MQVLTAVGSMIVTGANTVETVLNAVNEGALALNELAQKGHKHAGHANAQTDKVLALNDLEFNREATKRINKLFKQGMDAQAIHNLIDCLDTSEATKTWLHTVVSSTAQYAKPQAPVAPAPAPAASQGFIYKPAN